MAVVHAGSERRRDARRSAARPAPRMPRRRRRTAFPRRRTQIQPLRGPSDVRGRPAGCRVARRGSLRHGGGAAGVVTVLGRAGRPADVVVEPTAGGATGSGSGSGSSGARLGIVRRRRRDLGRRLRPGSAGGQEAEHDGGENDAWTRFIPAPLASAGPTFRTLPFAGAGKLRPRERAIGGSADGCARARLAVAPRAWSGRFHLCSKPDRLLRPRSRRSQQERRSVRGPRRPRAP